MCSTKNKTFAESLCLSSNKSSQANLELYEVTSLEKSEIEHKLMCMEKIYQCVQTTLAPLLNSII